MGSTIGDIKGDIRSLDIGSVGVQGSGSFLEGSGFRPLKGLLEALRNSGLVLPSFVHWDLSLKL